jgi:hypothetical protein
MDPEAALKSGNPGPEVELAFWKSKVFIVKIYVFDIKSAESSFGFAGRESQLASRTTVRRKDTKSHQSSGGTK